MEPFNKLSLAEIERLAVLSEELGEVQQIIGKILRHGYDSSHPSGLQPPNRELLTMELGDVINAANMLMVSDIEGEDVWARVLYKKETIGKYLYHQE